MSNAEYAQESAAFDEHGSSFGNPPETTERRGFVAVEDGQFVGASSGLVQVSTGGYSPYFFLTDLLVVRAQRGRGYGARLLALLEDRIREMGIKRIWTWTAEFEADGFYQRQGYSVFAVQPGFYRSGHARIGLVKNL